MKPAFIIKVRRSRESTDDDGNTVTVSRWKEIGTAWNRKNGQDGYVCSFELDPSQALKGSTLITENIYLLPQTKWENKNETQ